MATATPSKPGVFNLANQLTASRLVLSVVLFVLIALQYWLTCVFVFAAAAFTDWLDGYLARKQGLISALGRVFDPLVDKVLICGAYIFLLTYSYQQTGLMPWMVTVVVARELIINALRSYLEGQGVVFGADWLGKLKMGLQCAVLFGVFIVLHAASQKVDPVVVALLAIARDVLIYSMIAATALSGMQYLWRAAILMMKPGGDSR
jgi:CDP-diacylglycerol--glycerol-3-phosphate 3-phosphatidyltransferase